MCVVTVVVVAADDDNDCQDVAMKDLTVLLVGFKKNTRTHARIPFQIDVVAVAVVVVVAVVAADDDTDCQDDAMKDLTVLLVGFKNTRTHARIPFQIDVVAVAVVDEGDDDDDNQAYFLTLYFIK